MKIVSQLEDHITIKSLSIFTIWLFQLTAIVGITLGHYHWFISKTPLNLIITAVLLIVNFPLDSSKKIQLALFVILSSLFIEWVGVHFGFLFGVYTYGANLGLKIDGVPLLIGINWLVLILSTGVIADRFAKPLYAKIILGAFLMVFIDFFIEASAPPFDFWVWESGAAPLRNYVAWFVVSALLHLVYHLSKVKGDVRFSFHLYAAQLTFFIYFYWFHSLR